MLSIIVLAAGLSSRMKGAHKLLLPYQEKTIIWHTISQIMEAKSTHIGISEIIVVVGHNRVGVENALKDCDLPIIFNEKYADGMTTSIQAGIRAARSQATGYMICLSDQPKITAEHYNLLVNAFENQPKAIIIPTFQGERGNPVIFPAALREAILQHTEMTGCKAIVQSHKKQVQMIEMPTAHVLLDIDTPEDYESCKL
jgi:molybdenum cofactor cytidylyltransferase